MKQFLMKLFHLPRVVTGHILGPAAFLYLKFFTDLDPEEPAVTYTLAADFMIGIIFGTNGLVALPAWAIHH